MTIQISESTARQVVRLLEDFRHIEERARCSNEYFRAHFTALVTKSPWMAEAEHELRAALEEKPKSKGSTRGE